jgi:hypothetical protein
MAQAPVAVFKIPATGSRQVVRASETASQARRAARPREADRGRQPARRDPGRRRSHHAGVRDHRVPGSFGRGPVAGRAVRGRGPRAVRGLLDYPDGRLAGISPGELAAHARAGGQLAFDTGITGHPDHRTATAAAVLGGQHAGLPVLAWALPQAVVGQLKAETGSDFAGQPPGMIDLCVRVSRSRQRRAALLRASQVSPARSCGGASSCRANASACAGSSRQSRPRRDEPCRATPGARPGPGCRSRSARPPASARSA